MATLFAPIQAIIFGITLCFIYSLYMPSWFGYHPMFMLLGYVGFMSNGIFFEKFGRSHWTHMIMQVICAICVNFAWYVIWTNKEMAKKHHNTTWHSWIGVGCLLMNNMQCIGSAVNLWPSKPKKERKPMDVTLHKWGGRILFIAICVALHLGFYTLRRTKTMQVVLFDAFLASVTVICLTRWVHIPSLWNKIKI